MGWQRKQYDKHGNKVKKVFKGEKDWTRQEKEQIRQYQENYERNSTNEDRRKAG